MKFLVTLVAVSLFAVPAFAQKTNVKVPGVDITTDKSGNSTVKTGNVEVKSDDDGGEVKTGNVKVKGKNKKTKKKVAKKTYAKGSVLECAKNENKTIDGKEFAGKVAIHAHGNCNLTIKNSKIKGTEVALHVHGNSNVTVIDSEISSDGWAIHVHGNSNLVTKDTTIKGKVKHHGNALYNGKPK